MVLYFSDALLKTADPNSGIYGDWIWKKDKFNITCKFCKSNVCLKEGEKALSKHSSTVKHRKTTCMAGGSITKVFAAVASRNAEEKTIGDRARDAEIIYLHHVEAHGIAPHAAACASKLFQQMFPDSQNSLMHYHSSILLMPGLFI